MNNLFENHLINYISIFFWNSEIDIDTRNALSRQRLMSFARKPAGAPFQVCWYHLWDDASQCAHTEYKPGHLDSFPLSCGTVISILSQHFTSGLSAQYASQLIALICHPTQSLHLVLARRMWISAWTKWCLAWAQDIVANACFFIVFRQAYCNRLGSLQPDPAAPQAICINAQENPNTPASFCTVDKVPSLLYPRYLLFTQLFRTHPEGHCQRLACTECLNIQQIPVCPICLGYTLIKADN